MVRRWSLSAPLLVLLAFGCARPADTALPLGDVSAGAALQPGDVVRPEVSFAPREPWPVGEKVTIGVLARVERPGGKSHYLMDEDVPIERAVVRARVTFLDGDRPLGDPLEVPLVHDC